MEQNKQLTCMCIIANRKLKDEIINAVQNVGINLTNIVYGKGVVKAGFLQNMLGLVPEDNKVVLFSMTTAAKRDVAFAILLEKFEFDKPNTGIAFSVPIEGVLY